MLPNIKWLAAKYTKLGVKTKKEKIGNKSLGILSISKIKIIIYLYFGKNR